MEGGKMPISLEEYLRGFGFSDIARLSSETYEDSTGNLYERTIEVIVYKSKGKKGGSNREHKSQQRSARYK
jgi:hypothetical protein